jgi:hypothetical protein
MEPSIVAMVKINFLSKRLERKDMPGLETLIRSDKRVNNLFVNDSEMSFYIWGGDRVEYAVLDQFKEQLIENGYQNFVISANEYQKTERKYFYDPTSNSQ